MSDTPPDGHTTANDLDVEILILVVMIAPTVALPGIVMRVFRNASDPPGVRMSGEGPPAGVPAPPEACVLATSGVLPVTSTAAAGVATIGAAQVMIRAALDMIPETSEWTNAEYEVNAHPLAPLLICGRHHADHPLPAIGHLMAGFPAQTATLA